MDKKTRKEIEADIVSVLGTESVFYPGFVWTLDRLRRSLFNKFGKKYRTSDLQETIACRHGHLSCYPRKSVSDDSFLRYFDSRVDKWCPSFEQLSGKSTYDKLKIILSKMPEGFTFTQTAAGKLATSLNVLRETVSTNLRRLEKEGYLRGYISGTSKWPLEKIYVRLRQCDDIAEEAVVVKEVTGDVAKKLAEVKTVTATSELSEIRDLLKEIRDILTSAII